jgi:Ca2+-binding EF-hand superfamily protein
MPKEDAEDMFKRFDTNQDGRIEFPDFVKMVVPHEYDIAEDEVLAVMKLLPIELADV